MRPEELGQLILSIEQHIWDTITTVANWEVWMQVETALLLRQRGILFVREAKYPLPLDQRLDILGRDDNRIYYAIELKVQSTTKLPMVGALMRNVQLDQAKLLGYRPPEEDCSVHRWAVGVAYADDVKQQLSLFASNRANNAYYIAGRTIGILICVVDAIRSSAA